MPPKRPYFFFFFRSLSPKDPRPFSPTFTQCPPIFNKLLVTERPWHIFVTQNPSFAQLIVKQVTIFDKIRFFKNFDKVDEMVWNSWPFWPWKPLFFDAFHWKTLYFCALFHWKTPFLTQFVTELEDPYIWGTWWHWYVTFICECPPGFSFTSFLCAYISESWLHQVESLEFAVMMR